MLYKYFFIYLIPNCIAIGVIDYLILSRWLKCDYCSSTLPWTTFILPTILEMFCLIVGIIIGINLR